MVWREPLPVSSIVPPKQVERGDSLYGPAMLPGARGLGAPASGGSRRRLAVTRCPPRMPVIAPLLPGIAVPWKWAVLPVTQLTSPESFVPSRRSLAPSVFWVFVKLTNSPDCLTSNEGPPAAGWVGAVIGSGAPVGLGGRAPRHATGPVAS